MLRFKVGFCFSVIYIPDFLCTNLYTTVASLLYTNYLLFFSPYNLLTRFWDKDISSLEQGDCGSLT